MSDTQNQIAGGQSEDERLGVVVGERTCIRCGFSLVGQPTLREKHYGLVIARCPECGTVASLQEYPLLGRWARRWAMVLAGAYFLVVVSLISAAAGQAFGWSTSINYDASQSFADVLGARHKEWGKQNITTDPDAPEWEFQQALMQSGSRWLKDQDPKDLLEEDGGWFVATKWSALNALVPMTLQTVVFGCALAVVLVGLRMRRLLLLVVPLCTGLAAVFLGAYVLSFDRTRWLPAWYIDYSRLAIETLGFRVAWFAVAYSAVPLALGLLLGRPLVRWVIATFLPGQHVGAFAWLWTSDGLDPPRPHNHAGSRAEKPVSRPEEPILKSPARDHER